MLPATIAKPGDLLVRRHSRAKTVAGRVVKVLKINKIQRSVVWTDHTYDVTYIDGMKWLNVRPTMFMTFKEYRQQIIDKIKDTNTTLTNQHRELDKLEQLEAAAKKEFSVIGV
jgi:hypothetical protein